MSGVLENNAEQETMVAPEAICSLDRWIIVIGRILSLLFLLSASIIMVEIIARYVFNSPTFWVHETTTMLCAICFIYGGSHCLAKNRHIRIGLLYDAVSSKVRRWLDVFIALSGVVYSLAMGAGAWVMMKGALFTPWGAFRLETSGSAWDPPLPAIVKTAIFCMLVLMTIQFVLHFLIHLRRDSRA